MQLVDSIDCGILGEISKKMSQWNRILLEDDSEFWRRAIATFWIQSNPSSSVYPTEGDTRPEFVLPQGPVQSRCGEIMEAQYCGFNSYSDQTHSRCCEHVQSLLEKPIHEPQLPPH